MPVVFGSSPIPDETNMRRVQRISLPFLTDAKALAPLIPYHFILAPEPIVTLGGSMNMGVDWLGGRNYNVVAVIVDVIASDADGSEIRAPYPLVIWESDAAPIIAGREFQGYAKMFGQIPDHDVSDDAAEFQLSEYGNPLLRGNIDDLVTAPPAVMERAQATQRITTLGWKYIPGPGNIPDADYPTKLISYREISELKIGSGTFEVFQPSHSECPFSARIVEVLRRLPVLEMRPATLTIGSNRLARDEVTRLPRGGQ